MTTSKIALVTGASRGLGNCLTQSLLREAYSVIAHVRDSQAKVELAGAALKWGVNTNNLTIVAAELSEISQLEMFCREIIEKCPRLDLLINNAGVFSHQDDKTLQELSLSFLWKAASINFLAPAAIIHFLAPLLLASRHGIVVNVLTDLIQSNTFDGAFPAYRATKAALANLTANQIPSVAAFCTIGFDPGWMRTDMGGANAPDDPRDMANRLLSLVRKPDLLKSGAVYRGADIGLTPESPTY